MMEASRWNVAGSAWSRNPSGVSLSSVRAIGTLSIPTEVSPRANGVGPRLFFQRVPEGKIVKNRLHLDVRAGAGLVGAERLAVLEAEGARLIALGAAPVLLQHADDENESCYTLQDIEGNEFCLD